MATISNSAFSRLFALQRAELTAVKQMLSGDGYSDFFVEGSGPPWHEAFTDVVNDKREQRTFTPARFSVIDGVRVAAADGGYSDFFVEGSGPPWHEAFGDAGGRDLTTLANRARALSQLRVIDAYVRAKAAR